MTDSLSPEQVGFSWLLLYSGGKRCRLSPLLLRWEAVQTVTSSKGWKSFHSLVLMHGTSELGPEVVELEVEILFLLLLCESRLSAIDSVFQAAGTWQHGKTLKDHCQNLPQRERTEHDSFKFNVSRATVEDGEQCAVCGGFAWTPFYISH